MAVFDSLPQCQLIFVPNIRRIEVLIAKFQTARLRKTLPVKIKNGSVEVALLPFIPKFTFREVKSLLDDKTQFAGTTSFK